MDPLHKFNSTYQLHAFQNVAFQFLVVAKINQQCENVILFNMKCDMHTQILLVNLKFNKLQSRFFFLSSFLHRPTIEIEFYLL
jgi:hypothetical protein